MSPSYIHHHNHHHNNNTNHSHIRHQTNNNIKSEYDLADEQTSDQEDELENDANNLQQPHLNQQYSFPLDLTLKPKQSDSYSSCSSSAKKRKLDYCNSSQSDNENELETDLSADNNDPYLKRTTASTNRPALTNIEHLKLLTTRDNGPNSSSSSSSHTTNNPNQPQPSPSFSSSGNMVSTKPLKSILPPVSQEQFDKYSAINTDELVKRVKDLLSKFSISQRLFGECILGLSQGSVSDLLARPKPWVMLTQKGREPFIRMQMFIDDPESIRRLMANQYKGSSTSGTGEKVVQQQQRTPSLPNMTIQQGLPNTGGLLQINATKGA